MKNVEEVILHVNLNWKKIKFWVFDLLQYYRIDTVNSMGDHGSPKVSWCDVYAINCASGIALWLLWSQKMLLLMEIVLDFL